MTHWKTVPGTNYEVSDCAEVRNKLSGTPVKPYWQGKYLAFTMHGGGSRRVVRLHCAVLEAFVGPRPDGAVGAHLDGDPANCHVGNLAWATRAENERHKLAHGTDARGEKSSQAKFTNSEAELVRKGHGLGLTIIDLARLTKVNPSTIHDIVSNRRYH